MTNEERKQYYRMLDEVDYAAAAISAVRTAKELITRDRSYNHELKLKALETAEIAIKITIEELEGEMKRLRVPAYKRTHKLSQELGIKACPF